MKEGFFLYRVQLDDAGISVNQAVAHTLPILTHPTESPFSRGNPAPPGAQFALDLASTQGGEVGGELCLDEALLRHLCPRGLRKGE